MLTSDFDSQEKSCSFHINGKENISTYRPHSPLNYIQQRTYKRATQSSLIELNNMTQLISRLDYNI